MIKKVSICFITILFSALAFAENGVVTIKSKHSVIDTANKLESTLTEKGMKVFARIDHEAGAGSVGIELRPTQLIIFGNPKVGAPLMQCAQQVALDLPQKALIWKDEPGNVWLSYNDPAYLEKRHNIGGCAGVLDKISGALAKFSRMATQ